MPDTHQDRDVLGPLGDGPYGPCTPRVRRFLVQLAGLGNTARTEVVTKHLKCSAQPSYHSADRTLADTIARAGREDARDALAGPLFQLVQLEQDAVHNSAMHATNTTTQNDDPLHDLDPIAEPALAAALALLVSDVLPVNAFTDLYAPFAGVIPIRGDAG